MREREGAKVPESDAKRMQKKRTPLCPGAGLMAHCKPDDIGIRGRKWQQYHLRSMGRSSAFVTMYRKPETAGTKRTAGKHVDEKTRHAPAGQGFSYILSLAMPDVYCSPCNVLLSIRCTATLTCTAILSGEPEDCAGRAFRGTAVWPFNGRKNLQCGRATGHGVDKRRSEAFR